MATQRVCCRRANRPERACCKRTQRVGFLLPSRQSSPARLLQPSPAPRPGASLVPAARVPRPRLSSGACMRRGRGGARSSRRCSTRAPAACCRGPRRLAPSTMAPVLCTLYPYHTLHTTHHTPHTTHHAPCTLYSAGPSGSRSACVHPPAACICAAHVLQVELRVGAAAGRPCTLEAG